MKTRPMLFSGPMVRALLAGTKTQTRRALKIQPIDIIPMPKAPDREWVILEQREPDPRGQVIRCRYGVPGDKLWVRETWCQPTSLDPGPVFYRADYPDCVPSDFQNVPPAEDLTWKPSIHMRREHCRLSLRITNVRVQRLQDISEKDARAEGVSKQDWQFDNGEGPETYREAFGCLWDHINGAGEWEKNPWVWAISFERSPATSGAKP